MNERRSFYRDCPTIKFKKGQAIFEQDEIPKHVYSIKSGVVEVTNLTSTGYRQSISFEIVGDIVPKCWAFSKSTKTLFYYSAYTDCEFYVFKKETFLSELADNINFTNKILKLTTNALIGARLQIDSLEKPTARLKLLYTFRYLCLMYGEAVEKCQIRLLIPLTQQNIADHVGLTRETTNIELNKLISENIITHDRKTYVVNTEMLKDRIDDEFNTTISMLPWSTPAEHGI